MYESPGNNRPQSRSRRSIRGYLDQTLLEASQFYLQCSPNVAFLLQIPPTDDCCLPWHNMSSRPRHLTVQLPSKLTRFYSVETNDGLSPLAVSIAETVSPSSTITMEFGPGRTMDTLLGFMGARLTSLISRISERQFKKGPNALVGVMINCIKWKRPQCANVDCTGHPRSWRLGGRAGLREVPPSLEDVVELLFSPYCRTCRDSFATLLSDHAVFAGGCEKLVAQLRNANSSARLLSAYYICALASFHPLIRQIFIDLEAPEVLQTLVLESKILPSGLSAESSRRALASVSESAILPVIKDFDALELKLGEYHGQKLTDNEMIALLPYTATTLAHLFRGLMEPHLQVLAASRLSSSLVWQELSWTSVGPGFKRSLNSRLVQSLWHLVTSTLDPVVFGVIGCLMNNLYEFGSLCSAGQWDILEGRYIPSFLWAWHTLWMPLFHLRLYYPLRLQRVALRYLQDICNVFFRWPLLALLISVEARASIRTLRELAKQAVAMATHNDPYAREDPVLGLMLVVTDPLFEIAGLLQEERLVALKYDGYDIPRHIPYPRLKELCSQAVAVIMSKQTSDEICMSPSFLEVIAPSFDALCQAELQVLLEPYKSSKEFFQRRRAGIILKALGLMERASDGSLHCTGITAGVVHSHNSAIFGVYSGHYKGPWPPGRCYDPHCPFATLLVEETYRDLRWISIPDLQVDGIPYRPLAIPVGKGDQYISRRRNQPLDEGQYILLNASDLRSGAADDLCVLCGHTCAEAQRIFWMTRTKLIHAFTGNERPNDLLLSNAVHTHVGLTCHCAWTWRRLYSGDGVISQLNTL